MTCIRPIRPPLSGSRLSWQTDPAGCETSPAQTHRRWVCSALATEHEEVPMPSIVGGLDIHRKQLTFDYLDTVTGEVRRGQIAPADREHLRSWLARFQNPGEVAFAAEACTGWRYVTEELQRAGTEAHLAEPADTAAARGRKKRAKTDRADARLQRDLLAQGRSPNAGSRRGTSWSAGRCWRPITTCAPSTPRGSSASTRSCFTRAHRRFMTSAGRTRRSSWPSWPAATCRRPGRCPGPLKMTT